MLNSWTSGVVRALIQVTSTVRKRQGVYVVGSLAPDLLPLDVPSTHPHSLPAFLAFPCSPLPQFPILPVSFPNASSKQ